MNSTLLDFDRMLFAADERALTQFELDQVAAARAKVAVLRVAYQEAVSAVLAVEPIATRAQVARVRTVASASLPGATHTLRRVGSTWVCSRPGFRYRGKCRHAMGAAA